MPSVRNSGRERVVLPLELATFPAITLHDMAATIVARFPVAYAKFGVEMSIK